MNTPIDELIKQLHSMVQTTYATERQTGFLRLDALRSDATFWVAEQLAHGASIELLNSSPAWLSEELYDWVAMFRRDGGFRVVSNVGEVDHSVLFALVAARLP